MIDPYGVFIAQGAQASPGVPIMTEIDLSKGTACYAPKKPVPMGDKLGYVEMDSVPQVTYNLREEILSSRRPELYEGLLNPSGSKPIYMPGKGAAKLPDSPNLALNKKFKLEPETNYKGYFKTHYDADYKPDHTRTLTDGILARTATTGDRWVVWSNHPNTARAPFDPAHTFQEAVVTVDLEESKAIHYAAIHASGSPMQGSPFPKVGVEVSENGQEFAPVAQTDARAQGYLQPGGWVRVDWLLAGPFETKARFVRFKLGFGAPRTHVAVDEVAVY